MGAGAGRVLLCFPDREKCKIVMSTRHDPRLRALLKDFGDGLISLVKKHPRKEWKWEDLETELKRTFTQVLRSTHSPEELPDGVLAIISNKLSSKDASNFRETSRSIRGKVAVEDLTNYKEYTSMVDFLYDFAHTPDQKDRDAKRADAKSSGKWKWTGLEPLLENLDILWKFRLEKILQVVKDSYADRVEVPWADWRKTLMEKTKPEMEDRMTYEAVLEILRAKRAVAAQTLILGYFPSGVMRCVDPALKERLVAMYLDNLQSKLPLAFTDYDLETMIKNEPALADRKIRTRVLQIVRAHRDHLYKKYDDKGEGIPKYEEHRLGLWETFLASKHSHSRSRSKSSSQSPSGTKSGSS